MSIKSNKTSDAPSMNTDERALRGRLLGVSIALVAVSLLKVLAAVFFDLGAITNFTGQLNPDLAVESGMGRLCLAGGLVLFMAGTYCLNARRADERMLKNAFLIAVIAAICGVATFAIGIADSHNLSDIVLSLAGAALAAMQARFISLLRN